LFEKNERIAQKSAQKIFQDKLMKDLEMAAKLPVKSDMCVGIYIYIYIYIYTYIYIYIYI
jgi:hypothetical protein